MQTLLGKEDVEFNKEDLTLLAPDSSMEFDILKQIKERRKKAKLAKKVISLPSCERFSKAEIFSRCAPFFLAAFHSFEGEEGGHCVRGTVIINGCGRVLRSSGSQGDVERGKEEAQIGTKQEK